MFSRRLWLLYVWMSCKRSLRIPIFKTFTDAINDNIYRKTKYCIPEDAEPGQDSLSPEPGRWWHAEEGLWNGTLDEPGLFLLDELGLSPLAELGLCPLAEQGLSVLAAELGSSNKGHNWRLNYYLQLLLFKYVLYVKMCIISIKQQLTKI